MAQLLSLQSIYLIHRYILDLFNISLIADIGNDQNFQRGVFSSKGKYFGFSARGVYTPSEKTGSSAFRAI